MGMEIASRDARYSVSFRLTHNVQYGPDARAGAETREGLTVEPDHDQEDAHDNRGGDGAAGGLNWILVRQGESRERGYDLLTVCPSRLCSRRSDRRAPRRWDGSFRSSVRSRHWHWRKDEEVEEKMQMKRTARIAMTIVSHATYGAIRSYVDIEHSELAALDLRCRVLTKPLRRQSRCFAFGGASALESVNQSWSTSAKVDIATLYERQIAFCISLSMKPTHSTGAA